MSRGVEIVSSVAESRCSTFTICTSALPERLFRVLLLLFATRGASVPVITGYSHLLAPPRTSSHLLTEEAPEEPIHDPTQGGEPRFGWEVRLTGGYKE